MQGLKNNISVVVFAGLILGFTFPTFGRLITPILQPLLMMLTFLGTIDIKIDNVIADIKKPGKTLLALFIIHLAGPMMILFLRDFFSDEIFLGLIIATSVSSGIAIIILSKLFGGNPAKALVLTTISNFAAPLTIPILVLILAQTQITIDPIQMSVTIIKLILIPFAIAQIVAKTSWKHQITQRSGELSLIVLFFLIIGVIASVRDLLLINIILTFKLAIVLTILSVVLFILGYLLGSNKASKITYAISPVYRNFALATVLALTLFNPTVAIPSVIFTVVVHVLIIPFQWFLTKILMDGKIRFIK